MKNIKIKNNELIDICESIVREGLKELEKQEKEQRLNEEMWRYHNGF